jgi:hypothetical protein
MSRSCDSKISPYCASLIASSRLQVLALGGLKGDADAANSGYFAARGLLAKSVAEAARFIVDRGVVAEGGPVLAAHSADRLRGQTRHPREWASLMVSIDMKSMAVSC